MRAPLFLAAAVLAPSLLTACDDPCLSQPDPTVEIGRLVGAASFEPFEDGDEVQLGFAPQGGEGVAATLRTTGMSAHETMIIFPRSVSTQLVVEGTDEAGAVEEMGDFPLSPSIYCVDNEYGLVTNVIFGLDVAYPAESVAGRAVTLKVDVKDENDARASASVDVVFAEMQ